MLHTSRNKQGTISKTSRQLSKAILVHDADERLHFLLAAAGLMLPGLNRMIVVLLPFQGMLSVEQFFDLGYKFIKPDKSIAEFVYGFLMVKDLWKIKEIVLIPNARTDLFFVKEKDNQVRIALVGLETKPNNMPFNGHAIMFGISFNLLAVEYVFGFSIANILDSQIILPDNFWGFTDDDFNDFDLFCEKMSLKIRSLLRYKIDERKLNLFNLIYEADGEISIKELSEKVFWSARQINQYFNQQFGLSLKKYCNILRFQASLSYIKQGKLFPQLNYFDQSHFIKEIKRLSGASPKELLKNKNSRFLQFLAIDIK